MGPYGDKSEDVVKTISFTPWYASTSGVNRTFSKITYAVRTNIVFLESGDNNAVPYIRKPSTFSKLLWVHLVLGICRIKLNASFNNKIKKHEI